MHIKQNIKKILCLWYLITDCGKHVTKDMHTLRVCLPLCVCVCVCVCVWKTARHFHYQYMAHCHNQWAFKCLMLSYKNMNILKRNSTGLDKIKCNSMAVTVLR